MGVFGVVTSFGGAGLGWLAFGAGFSGAGFSGNLAFGAGVSVMGGVMGSGKVGGAPMPWTEAMALSDPGVTVGVMVGAAVFGDKLGDCLGTLEASQTANMSSRLLLPLPCSFCFFRKSYKVSWVGVVTGCSSRSLWPAQRPRNPSKPCEATDTLITLTTPFCGVLSSRKYGISFQTSLQMSLQQKKGVK